MSMQSVIDSKLRAAIQAEVLHIENESHMHSGPATESHFKLTLVSNDFAGKTLIARHRMINEILQEELAGGIHALTLHTLTPEEYEKKQGQVRESPACQGGGKH